MIVACPRCGSKYNVNEARVSPAGEKFRCARCKGLFMVRPILRPKEQSLVSPSVISPAVPPPSRPEKGGPTVLVAHESEAVRNMLVNILSRAHVSIVEVKDGVEAFMQIQKLRPRIAILDVALPKMFGFEVCEVIKREEGMKGIRIVLLASAYDRTRLRRKPETLFGADGYLEKHQIQEELLPLVTGFLQPPSVPPEGTYAEAPIGTSQGVAGGEMLLPGPSVPEPSASLYGLEAPPDVAPRQAPEVRPPAYTEEEQKDLEKAHRLARIIVSDIALYNKELVDEGVRSGRFYDLLDRDVTEGRELYVARTPEWIRKKTNYLEECFEGLINSRKKELGLV